jgi:hypothetical protein
LGLKLIVDQRCDGKVFCLDSRCFDEKELLSGRRLSNLTMRQSRLIGMLVACDFNNGNAQDLENLASLIDGMVSDEREILKLACALGAEIRNWWSTSLLLLSEQTEHLDSIAESLHLAADPRGTALMAMAVEEFTAANQLATQ